MERLQIQGSGVVAPTASAAAGVISLRLASQAARQALSEKLGRGSRTVDPDLEAQLELLRDDRQRYEHVTALAQTLANQLAQFTVTQRTLGDAFSDLGLKTPSLHVSDGHGHPQRSPPPPWRQRG